ncbi:MAG: RNA 3'-terminal phosphate cyclase [Candidatus Hydrogenedentes bacterium]|nr:RNA 3'-terminal phosphate cyclase [Candidatus Hydrogenedentota bacterium]
MVHIDGSQGEGGGQVLRTSLALSVLTGKPFVMERIRAGRKKPGLARQHMMCVEAAAAISGAEVEGNGLGSQSLRFQPGTVQPGDFHFDIGTAGSTTLVLQTLLMPLLLADEGSLLTIEGGTHNPMAPPFEFIRDTFLPQLRAMGARVEVTCERPGFYPAGGGRLSVEITPARALKAYEMLDRGALIRVTAASLLSLLPDVIAERELAVVRRKLKLPEDGQITRIDTAKGPGNAVLITIEHEHIVEVVTAVGEKSVSAERVATGAAREAQGYLQHGAPVGEHLADQLLLPMAVGGGGRFRTGPLTEHTRTNMRTIEAFVDAKFETTQVDAHVWEIAVTRMQAGK